MMYTEFDFDEYCKVSNEYFEWLYDLVCGDRFSGKTSYRKLLMHLHGTEFTFTIQRDSNRAYDGQDLRHRFIFLKGYDDDVYRYFDGPCSILEMMVALAIRGETIMDDTRLGNRTSQWFWGMITNLGLGSMMDDVYDKKFVDSVIDRFLRRKYEPNGKGGLFTVRDRDCDMRKAEIWYQMNWYLDTII